MLQRKSTLDMSIDYCPSDECYTESFFSIHVPKSPAFCRFETHRPYVGVLLTVRHRRLRLNWIKGHYRWSRRKWNRVLFMDDSRLKVKFVDGRLRVWRRTGESMDENNIVERDRYGGGSVMIWGGILVCHIGKTELVTMNGRLNARRYCDEIIFPVVIPVLHK